MEQNQQHKHSKQTELCLLPSADDSWVNPGSAMCEEEWRIRGELEHEIERDLEEEIKDGIYHLAFRLHRLYQHKMERNEQEISPSGGRQKHHTLSEVNISIKMEGGTRIEIKESKKDGKAEPLIPRTRSSRSKHVKGTKFDWANSLRAGAAPAILNRKTERSSESKASSHDPELGNTRRNPVSGSATPGSVLRKGNMGVNTKVLELGWKW